MALDKIEYISKLLIEAEHWKKIGAWGSLIMLVALLTDIWFRHLYSGSIVFESALLGGFICCWGSNFDRANQFKKELDAICYQLFKKSYESSLLDIFEMRKNKPL